MKPNRRVPMNLAVMPAVAFQVRRLAEQFAVPQGVIIDCAIKAFLKNPHIDLAQIPESRTCPTCKSPIAAPEAVRDAEKAARTAALDGKRIEEWAAITGLSVSGVRARLRRGLSLEMPKVVRAGTQDDGTDWSTVHDGQAD